MPPRQARPAFTLIELLIVIAIIGVLVALLLPAVQYTRETARRIHCSNNLKQMGVGCHTYHDAHRLFPSGYLAAGPYVDGESDTTPGWGWAALMLPQMEQAPLSQQLDFTLPIEHPQNAAAIKTRLPIFLCPSDQLSGPTFPIPDAFGNTVAIAAPCSYAACCGGDESDVGAPTGKGLFFRNSQISFASILDGASNTVMFGDRAWGIAKGTWLGAINNAVCARGDYNKNPGNPHGAAPSPNLLIVHCNVLNSESDTDGAIDDFNSFHRGGGNLVFADGAVRFVREVKDRLPGGGYTTDGLILQALGTRAGSEQIPNDWLK